jgi:hypothetical protein
MRRLSSALSIALSVLWAAVGPAHAQKPTGSAGQASAAYVECFKQHGAAYDPASKKWTLHTTELHSMNMLDTIRDCISRRTGIPRNAIVIPEIPIY